MTLTKYFLGMTHVVIPNSTTSSIVNKLSSHNVKLYNVTANEYGTDFYIVRKNRRLVLSLYPEAVVHSKGFQKDIKTFIKRSTLIAISMILLVLWWLSGQIILEFEVSGNYDVSDFEILSALSRHGIKTGTLGISVDSEKLSNIMLCEIPQLSWFAINITGSHASVSVRERILKPEVVDPYDYRNVYAEKSGTVLSVEVYDGTRLVSVGDTVLQGDMLVSGITESYTGMRQEHALARIYAEVNYEISASTPIKSFKKLYTGEADTRYSIDFSGHLVNLCSGSKSKFKHSDGIVTENRLSLFGIDLPIRIIKTTYREYDTQSFELTDEECERILKNHLSDSLKSETNGDILTYHFDTHKQNGLVTVTLTAKCRERIA